MATFNDGLEVAAKIVEQFKMNPFIGCSHEYYTQQVVAAIRAAKDGEVKP